MSASEDAYDDWYPVDDEGMVYRNLRGDSLFIEEFGAHVGLHDPHYVIKYQPHGQDVEVVQGASDFRSALTYFSEFLDGEREL